MKSEHRHELAENDLGKLLEEGRDRIEPHRNTILLGLLVVTVLIIGAIVVYRTQSAKSMVGAAELAEASTPEEYKAVAERFPGTETGLWAGLRAGEGYLREGIRLSLTNRAASNDSLEQARKSLDAVVRAENVAPQIREQALFSLAVCLESLSSQQTTTKPAIEAYQRLLKDYKDTRYKARAEARIKELEKPGSQEFYAWFHAQNPKPEDRPRPMDFNNMPFQFPQDTGLPAEMPVEDAATGDAPVTGPALAEPATDSPAAEPATTIELEATIPEEGTPATDPATPAAEPEAPSESPTTPPTSESSEAATEASGPVTDSADPPAPPTSDGNASEPETTGPSLP